MYWIYDLCDRRTKQILYTTETTTSAINHLKSAHRIREDETNQNRNNSNSVFNQQRRAAAKTPIVKGKTKHFKNILL